MDQELKQRMIGAGVIIALAVIFVPMLFDGDIDEKHNKNISIQIPEEANNGLEVKKFSLDKPVFYFTKILGYLIMSFVVINPSMSSMIDVIQKLSLLIQGQF